MEIDKEYEKSFEFLNFWNSDWKVDEVYYQHQKGHTIEYICNHCKTKYDVVEYFMLTRGLSIKHKGKTTDMYKKIHKSVKVKG